ncbi:MAG: Ig-like domain-containing protein [Prevotella sp.]|nr:Ig-like domain-containing protein [Prevotella sp.]
MNPSKDRFTTTSVDNSNVQYVKFHFTKAATDYGIKIREVSIFGTESAAPTSISLSAPATEVVAGKQVTLTVKKENDRVISPSLVTFSSSNDAIAAVDENGVVTAVEAGNVTITATLKSNNSISSTIDLTVNPKPEGLELTNGTHSIIVQTIKYTGTESYYEMIIYSDEEIDDIHNSYWKLNGGTENSAITPYINSTDKNILTVSNVNSTADPVFDTPIYLKMAGEAEITFGTADALNSNIAWVLIQKGDIAEAVTVKSETSEEISGGTNSGKKIEYTWEFTQTGSNQVTLKFKCTNETEITGLVYPETLTAATTGAVKTGEGEWTWYGQQRGKTLTGKCLWQFTDGSYTTPAVEYIVRDPLIINEATGTAAITGELRPANVGDINNLAAENNKIDVTGLTIKQAAAIVPANNPNAVVVATSTQKSDLAGTENLVIKDGDNYTADKIAYTDVAGTAPVDLAIKTSDVTFTRKNIANEKMISVSMPFPAAIPEGFKAYQLDSYNSSENSITFKEVESLSAGVAYIIVNKSGDTKDFVATKTSEITLDFTEKTTNTSESSAHTTANLKQVKNNTGAEYVLSDGKIKKLAGTAKVAAFRGYFTFTVAPSRDLDVTLEDGLSSGINNLKDGAIKEVIFYDLNGHRVDNPTKGLYIVNGKKVIMK